VDPSPRPEPLAGSASLPDGGVALPGGGLADLAGAHGRTALLVGVGGSGMRGLARLLLQAGWTVFGADRRMPPPDDPLWGLGLRAHDGGALPPVSWAVRSAAVPEDDPAFREGLAGGARPATYAELLGAVTRLRPTLTVAGSHGKTTTTNWIAWALRREGREVGFLAGATARQLGVGADWGDDAQPLVLESCEYARSFHHLRPWRVALLNVDAEHPDTYPGGLPEVEEAFRRFLAGCPAVGEVVAGPEAPDLSGATAARWLRAESLPDDWEVGLPGEHNRRNAALVAAVLRRFGLDEAAVRSALRDFRGCERRLEELGTRGGALVVSDYAHHPVEVEATLQAARERWSDRPFLVVFQPHQAQRFHALRDRFAPALDAADRLLLLEVHRVRDPDELRASVAELVPELVARRDRPLAVANDPEAARALVDAWAGPGAVVLCLGAGDVDDFARTLPG